MSWIKEFDQKYHSLLTPHISGAKRGLQEGIGQRFAGFRLMFEILLSQRDRDFRIIETGTLRNPGNWKDGQSARIFTEFVDQHGGSVHSVDIDPVAVSAARAAIDSTRFQSHCSDSVTWLASRDDLDTVDLFYLDSWDVKWDNDTDSAQHHLREFQTIEPHLAAGTIVAIDDNARFLTDGRRTGKGRMIAEYLDIQGIRPIHDAYQIIYQF